MPSTTSRSQPPRVVRRRPTRAWTAAQYAARRTGEERRRSRRISCRWRSSRRSRDYSRPRCSARCDHHAAGPRRRAVATEGPHDPHPERSSEVSHKITASHLSRTAYLYVRQSTLRQVFENTESTTRQYALRERAVALGWPIERVVVIDSDLGQSGASAADRAGFQRLVTEVSLGHAGIVLGLEVSRLARNSADWHRLLELCALANTLILDEDGLYDPAHFNDRLLLGLKGTMSEAELHLLRAPAWGHSESSAARRAQADAADRLRP